MPYSSNTFDNVLSDHIYRLSPEKVLDVGSGSGKNGTIVKKINPNIILEGIEPTEKYIEEYNLNSLYNKIYHKDIQKFSKEDSKNRYDVVIIGDVLEHLFRTEVIDYLDYFLYRTKWLIAIWPTNLPQDDSEENHYEIHKNNFTLNDLTSKFNVVYYVSNFGGWHNDPKIEPCYFHYCVIKGHLSPKDKFVYNFPNWIK
jgi:SAM-dependent methyltransferase